MEIIVILLLIACNGVFAMAEIAIVTARRAKLQKLAHEGNKNAKTALYLSENQSEFLSTVSIGITLIGILAGAYGASSLSEPLAAVLQQIPLIAPFSKVIAFILVVVLITFLSLVFGEIVPKRIALLYSQQIAVTLSPLMKFFSEITVPLVSLLSISTDFILRSLNIKPTGESQISDEEVKLLIREGTRTGIFEAAEQDIVERTFRLSDKQAKHFMLPRSEIDWIDIDASFRTIRNTISKEVHSYYPVCNGSLDKIIGIVHTEEVLTNFLLSEKIDLQRALHKPQLIPESMPAFKLLELFKKSGIHIALVIDEYGSIQGLITLTDILEEIVGDIPEADELGEKDIMKRDDNSWLVNGLVPVDDFKDFFHIRKLPGEKTGLYHTVGGFVMNRLGKIPITGDKIQWENLKFEIVDMDENRIDKIMVTRMI